MRIFMSVLLSLMLSAEGCGPWYMRVVARDDTAAGQTEKIRVRDGLLPCYSPEEGVLAALPRMKRTAEELAADARVEIRLWAPAGRVPAPTVYVTLGLGEGRNWWGVLWSRSMTLSGAEEGDDPDRVEWTWPVWDWICRAVGPTQGRNGKNAQDRPDQSRPNPLPAEKCKIRIDFFFPL